MYEDIEDVDVDPALESSSPSFEDALAVMLEGLTLF
jgi:hypothetical protein